MRDALTHRDLMNAARDNDISTLNLYVEQGRDLDELDKTGMSALVIAVQYGRREFVVELLAYAPQFGQSFVGSALYMAHARGDSEIAELIYRQMTLDARTVSQGDLLAAIGRRDVGPVRRYLAQGNDVNFPLAGESLLTAASAASAHSIMRFLIAKGAKPGGSGNGDTPIHRAAERGDLVGARLLLDAGGEPLLRTRNGGGETVITSACTYLHHEMIEFLIAQGASTRDRNHLGAPIEVAMRAAGRTGRDEDAAKTIDILLANLRDEEIDWPCAGPRSTQTLIHLAVDLGSVLSIEALARRGAQVNVPSNANDLLTTPFLAACVKCRPEVIIRLAELGAATEVVDEGGCNALLISMRTAAQSDRRRNYLATITALLALGIDPDQVDNHGVAARADLQGNAETAHILAAHEARVAIFRVTTGAASALHGNPVLQDQFIQKGRRYDS